MRELDPPPMVLPVSDVARAYEGLRQQCRGFLETRAKEADPSEAHVTWGKLLRFHALLELARAADRVAEAEPALNRLTRWSWQCGAGAIPYLLQLYAPSRRKPLRRASLVAIAAACAGELETLVASDEIGGVAPSSRLAREASSGGLQVPATRCRVVVEGLDETLTLADTLAITKDWESTNGRRLELIEKKAGGKLTPDGTPEEWAEFERLQNLAGIKRQLTDPLPVKELAEIEADLRRRGLWQGV